MISEGGFQKSLTVFIKKTDPKELLKKLHFDVFGL
jgi:hypothetical protein